MKPFAPFASFASFASFALFGSFASSLSAQQVRIDSTPGLVRYGKWAGVAAFAGTMTMAVLENRDATNAFNRLREYCGTASCSIGANGRYTDAGAEARWNEIVANDRSARLWLVASQVTFVGTAALFVLELTREKGTTNIPYAGLLVEPGRLGWRLTF